MQMTFGLLAETPAAKTRVARVSHDSARRLIGTADRMEQAAQSKLDQPRLTNTRKRLQDAQRVENDCRREIQLAQTIRRIGQAQMEGPTGMLSAITSKAQVETLRSMMARVGDGGIDAATMPDAKFWAEETKRLHHLGVTTDDELRQILREFKAMMADKPQECPLKAAERALVGVKIPGFFPTPVHVAKMMVDIANLRRGMKVLEPSAGSGRIADAIAEAIGKDAVTCIEPSCRLVNLLSIKGDKAIANRFEDLAESVEITPTYDAVLMNPPFEKGLEMDHVELAYAWLKNGGRLVSIMSPGPFHREDKQSKAFRNWFDSVGGEARELPEGTFKESGTGVRTLIVTIDKDEPSWKSDWE